MSVNVAATPLAVHMYTPLSPSSAATISKIPVESRREEEKEYCVKQRGYIDEEHDNPSLDASCTPPPPSLPPSLSHTPLLTCAPSGRGMPSSLLQV